MTENKLQLFENEEFGRLEVLMIDGKPYFPATDTATILGYTNPRKAINDHCKGVTNRSVLTNGGTQTKKFIPEGDLYRLIIRSKLPSAERFERWVFDEVLPSIRQHGAYIAPEVLEQMLKSRDYTDTLLQALADEQARSRFLLDELEDEQAYSGRLERQIAEIEPKAAYYDLIIHNPGTVQVSLIAKDYGLSAASFNKLLRTLGIQYKMGNTWLLYQKYAGHGYTRSRTYYVSEYTTVAHTYWTQKGRFFLYDTLKSYGILPLAEVLESA